MKVLIGMNWSPGWVQTLDTRGFDAIHWSDVDDGGAPDSQLLEWAHDNAHVVFTNDLVFGDILAATGAQAPSVIQVRTQHVSPERLIDLVVHALEQYRSHLEQGALITVDEARLGARILPLVRCSHIERSCACVNFHWSTRRCSIPMP